MSVTPRALITLLLVMFVVSAPATGQADAPVDPLLRGFAWRNIGPVGQGGRVNDLAVVERDPGTFYVGFATAGIWKTTNAGTTFTPIFDTYGTHSIGDIAIAPSNPDILYVGTGEPNNRQSSSFGDGVYKTTDGGRSFTHTGLRETQTIARIVVHPTNPDLVWVAAVGHLFGPNPERGVYRSTDGGRTWTRVLYVDEHTGASELVIHPTNPDVLFATTYQRRRTAWGFVGGGPGSAIWRSDDGGERWTRVTGNGLPAGTMGRIGVAIARSNPQVVYAQIEVGPDREPARQAGAAAGGGGGGGGGFGQQSLPADSAVSGMWRSDDGGRSWRFLSNQNNRPMYYSKFAVDPNDENTLYVGGAQSFKSTDGGRTWRQLTGFGHGDHHAMWINPADSRHVMYGNDGSVDVSHDAGATWEALRTWSVGQPYHASVDMRRPYYVCTGLQDNGSWCGPSSVRSGAILPQDWYRVGGGDGFYTAVDPTDHLVMYSESQNGNMSRLDLREGTSVSIRPRAASGTQRSNIVPAPDSGTSFRWNWSTPMILSPHDPGTIYVGAERLFTSRDRGATWAMTGDLTRAIDRDQREIMGYRGTVPACSRQRVGTCINSKNDGVTAYGTLTTIVESPLVPGLIWVGSDDGNIQVTRNGGATWTEVGRNLPGGPKEYYVSRVEASRFDPGTAYASLDGHRSDDLRPYVFVTRDYGRTWAAITAGLPATGNVNTVRQDPRNPNLLYAGTEFGFFVSLDEGRNWKRFMPGLPVVRVDEVLVHPRENDLVLATHGRSVWVMDDVTALQQLTPAALAQETVLFAPRNPVLWKPDIQLRRSVTGAKNWQGDPAPRGTAIAFYLRQAPADSVTLVIREQGSAEPFRTIRVAARAGLNRVQWDLCSDLRPLQPGQGGFGFGGGGGGGGGTGCASGGQGAPPRVGRLASPGPYVVTLRVGGQEYAQGVSVLEDLWLGQR